MSWIQGNKFKWLAKFNYAPVITEFPRSDYRYLVNTFDSRQVEDGDIIYTHTFFAEQLFEWNLTKKVILITHNADTPVSIAPPDWVKTWWTTNVNIRHEKIKSLPIGIENDFWLKDKKIRMEQKLKQKKNYKNMLYLNHNVRTNPKERQKPYDLFRGQQWVTVNNGINGQGFDNYLDNIYNHPFVICPEGNGIDTHRVWECLYMRTVPIQKRNINNQFYTDLPILFIDDWEEVSEKFLHDSFMRMAETKWNMEKIDFNYWKTQIQNVEN